MADLVGDPIVRFKLLEPKTAVLPSDASGSLPDLEADGVTNQRPEVVDGITGPARAFTFATPTGLEAIDTAAVLRLTRTITVQAVVVLDLDAQDALGTPGTIVTLGDRDGAGEEMHFALELQVDDLATRRCIARLIWDDSAGTLQNTGGGVEFIYPTDGGAGYGGIILTAVREWLDADNVIVRYYANDLFLGRDDSTAGDIGGDTGATFTMGVRGNGGTYTAYFEGTIESVAVFDRLMTPEEIRQVSRRLFIHAPRQYEAIKALLPEDVYSNNPESIIQRELHGEAQMFGDVVSKAFEIREDFLPDRAWSFLDRWETVLGLIPGPSDTLSERRTRILSNLRTVEGFSVAGIKAALAASFDLDVADIEICENTHRLDDDFATAFSDFWEVWPGDHTIQITGGEFDLTLAAGVEHRFTELDSGDDQPASPFIQAPVDDDEAMIAHVLLSDPSLTTDGETLFGMAFANFTDINQAQLRIFGVYRTGGVNTLGHTRVALGTQDAITSLGAAPAFPFYLIMKRTPAGSSIDLYTAPAGDITDETFVANVSGTITVREVMLGGFGLAPFGPTNADSIDFDDFQLYTPQGPRVWFWFAYRDPALAGNYDLAGANLVIQRIKPAHTVAAAVTIKALVCDNGNSLCDDGPLGGFCP